MVEPPPLPEIDWELVAATKNPLELFELLWQEIDFDDHPLSGNHLPIPVGGLSYPEIETVISYGDSRVIFTLGHYPEILQEKYDKWYGEEGWEDKPENVSEGEDLRQHHMILVSRHPLEFSPSALAKNPKLHKWSIPAFWFKGELWFWPLNKFFQKMGDVDDFSAESIAGTVEMRYQLALWKERFSPFLPNWSWHLEIDNKIDRTGWYIRAPPESKSLFTIFLGYGWNPEKTAAAATLSTSSSVTGSAKTLEQAIRETPRCAILKEKNLDIHGFLIFERAPLGELDRPDEAQENELDVVRTELMCGPRGSLTALARTEGAGDDWARKSEKIRLSLPGQIELWPPSLKQWPLLMARSDVGFDSAELSDWLELVLDELGPTLESLKNAHDN